MISSYLQALQGGDIPRSLFSLAGAFPESVISQRARSSPSIPEQLLVSILTLYFARTQEKNIRKEYSIKFEAITHCTRGRISNSARDSFIIREMIGCQRKKLMDIKSS
jgi:hypothetical protein